MHLRQKYKLKEEHLAQMKVMHQTQDLEFADLRKVRSGLCQKSGHANMERLNEELTPLRERVKELEALQVQNTSLKYSSTSTR